MFKQISQRVTNIFKPEVISKKSSSSRNMFLGSNQDSSSPFTDQKAIMMYENVDVVYKAVDMISTNFSNVLMKVVEETKDGDVAVPNHPLQKLLDQPNGLQHAAKFQHAACAARFINGNSYLWLITDDNNSYEEPMNMWAMPVGSFTLYDLNTNWYYQYNGSTSNIKPTDRIFQFDPITGQSNIINWNTFDVNSFSKGMSPLEPINTNVDIYKNANEWNAKYFDNGCRPSMAFVNDNADFDMKEEDVKEMQKMVEERYTSRDKNGRPIVLDGFKPHELSTSAKDADFIESLKKQEAAIVRSLGIPPILLNSGEGSTYSNQQEARLSFWQETMKPLINSYVKELNIQLTPRYKEENLKIVADYSNIDVIQQVEQQKQLNSEYLTINEKRKMLGQDPVDGGDVLFVQSSLLPLDVAASGLGIITGDEEA